MRKSALSLIILFSVVGMNAQTVKPDRLDGVVYYKLKTDDRQSQQQRAKNTAFLQKYQVTDIVQSFAEADDSDLQRIFRVDFAGINNVDSLIAELQRDNNIEYAEPAPLFRTSAAPNDEFYSQQWYLDKINAPAAWDINEGNPNIKVAIVDNAVWTLHPDLQNKIVAQYDAADGDNNANPPASSDTNWAHGTHCAGLAAAETNNTIGIAGVGNRVSLIAVKTTRDNTANPRTLDAAFEGILWAADNGADIISMSFATDYPSRLLTSIINYAYNKGCILVAAAGNDNKETLNYPAALNHVIAVGNSDSNDKKSGSSNYGTWIDVMAPGNSIFSSINYSNPPYGYYGSMSGSSMACPITAGLCGLMLSANSDLTPKMLMDILKNTCDNIDALNSVYAGKLGAGRINGLAAVQAALSTNNLYADFYADNTNITKGNSIAFYDNSAGTPTSWLWEFQGGTPSTASEQNPSVTYNTAGVFRVKLTVGNGTSTESETKTTYITVSPETPSAWIEQSNNFLIRPNSYVTYTDIVDENTVWILSDSIEFSRTTTGGDFWASDVFYIDKSHYLTGISAVSGTTAWLLVSPDSIFKTTDGGDTWKSQPTAAFGAGSWANIIHFFNANEGVVQGDPVNGKFEIYTTTNGGTNWTLIPNTGNPAILSGEAGWSHCIAAYGNNVWFGTNKGRVFRSTDKGQTWQAYTTPAPDINTLSFADARNGVAICNSETTWKLLRTSDGGETWEEINAPFRYLNDVSAVPNKPGMLVGFKNIGVSQYSVYSLDYGDTWTTLDNGVPYSNVKIYSENIGYAGGFSTGALNGGGIYKWKMPAIITPVVKNLTPGIKIYPNPAEDIIYIESSEKLRYEVMDIMGTTVMQGVSDTSAPLNIGHLAKGCYFIKTYNNGVSVNKVIKK